MVWGWSIQPRSKYRSKYWIEFGQFKYLTDVIITMTGIVKWNIWKGKIKAIDTILPNADYFYIEKD